MMKVGVDLDHTIIDYHHAFLSVAREWSYVPPTFSGSKTEIKNYIVETQAEEAWMRLQGFVYSHMPNAALMSGVFDFFLECQRHHIPVVIISHKTVFGHFDESRRNLQSVAREWLSQQHFFDGKQGLSLQEQQLYFELTRDKKIERIASEQCTHFIDDLHEVLLEPAFPQNIKKIWYAPDAQSAPTTLVHLRHWRDVWPHIIEARHVGC